MLQATDTVVANLDRETQLEVVDEVRQVLAAAPLYRTKTPGGLDMSVRLSAAGELGWFSDARGYRYVPRHPLGTKWPPLPSTWAKLADAAVGETVPWDSAIINWFRPGASLGWHQDVSEVDLTAPIVTFSFGDSGRWGVKRWERGAASWCELASGAVTLLAGPTRLYFHTVSRIIPFGLLSPLRHPGRLSITIRVAGK